MKQTKSPLMPVTRDGPHLKYSLWYDKTVTGKYRLKRVSAERDKQFPREYRRFLADNSPGKLVALLRGIHNCSLATAWQMVKDMVNGKEF